MGQLQGLKYCSIGLRRLRILFLVYHRPNIPAKYDFVYTLASPRDFLAQFLIRLKIEIYGKREFFILPKKQYNTKIIENKTMSILNIRLIFGQNSIFSIYIKSVFLRSSMS